MTFTELCSLYEIYKKMSTVPAPTPSTVAQVLTPAPAPTQAPTPSAVAQVLTPAPVTNADLMAMLQAMQVPTVHGEAPKPESIDDVICRIAGIETNKEKK